MTPAECSEYPERVEFERQRKEIYERAIKRPQRERVGFIEAACTGNKALQDAVLRLIAAGSRKQHGLLDQPLYDRPSEHSVETLETIGPYRVIRLAGTGGMGKVYCCQDSEGSTVAIKLLTNVGLDPEEFHRRFTNEWEIQGRLRHPNVCRLLGAATSPRGTPYIVTEMIEGLPLNDFCIKRNSGLKEKLLIFSGVLAGVEYFHRQDVIHRDLKSGNILVTANRQAKILDFGIAKIVEHVRGLTGIGPTKTLFPRMTESYASPEQLQGRRSGCSSDIYSLGTILYQLVSGRHPFEAECKKNTAALVDSMRARQPVLPSRFRPDIPSRLDSAILTALQFEPSHRFRSAALFLEEIRMCIEQFT